MDDNMIELSIKNQSGFTLLEMIIYTAIIGIVISAFVYFALSISMVNNKNYAVLEVQTNARIMLNYISEQVKHASLVLSPELGEESDVLTLLISSSGENVRFFVDKGVLYVVHGSAEAEAISSSDVFVKTLSFSNYSSDNKRNTIGVNLELEYVENKTPEYFFSVYFETTTETRL